MKRWRPYSDEDLYLVRDMAHMGSNAIAEELTRRTGIKRTSRAIVSLCHRQGIRLGRGMPMGHEFNHKGITYIKTKSGYVSKDRISLHASDGDVVMIDPWGDKTVVSKSFAGRLMYYGYDYKSEYSIKIVCWNMAKLKHRASELAENIE